MNERVKGTPACEWAVVLYEVFGQESDSSGEMRSLSVEWCTVVFSADVCYPETSVKLLDGLPQLGAMETKDAALAVDGLSISVGGLAPNICCWWNNYQFSFAELLSSCSWNRKPQLFLFCANTRYGYGRKLNSCVKLLHSDTERKPIPVTWGIMRGYPISEQLIVQTLTLC